MHRAKTAPQIQGGGLAGPDGAAFVTASAKGRYRKLFIHYHRYKNRDEDYGESVFDDKKLGENNDGDTPDHVDIKKSGRRNVDPEPRNKKTLSRSDTSPKNQPAFNPRAQDPSEQERYKKRWINRTQGNTKSRHQAQPIRVHAKI